MPVYRVVLHHLGKQQGRFFAGAGGGVEGLVKRLLAGEKFVQGPEDLLAVQRLIFVNGVPLGVADGTGWMHGYHVEIFIHEQYRLSKNIVSHSDHVVGALVADRLVELFVDLSHAGGIHDLTSRCRNLLLL